jgi:hypothetical protein
MDADISRGGPRFHTVAFWSNGTVPPKEPDDPPEEIRQSENGADVIHYACRMRLHMTLPSLLVLSSGMGAD